jgi:3-methylfumaryl-CoA hydratase
VSEFNDWVGRSQTVTDTLDPARSNALSIALGGEGNLKAGDALPLLYHWLYFWDVKPPSGLGVDGHPAKGGFLPPVPLPRRMWAGGRLDFPAPIAIGAAMTRRSTLLSVVPKIGKSGRMVFVTVRHEVFCDDLLAITEEQDIVYREQAAAGIAAAPAAAAAFDARRAVMPDPVTLFRFSALTFNAHRIHYDRDYARDVESYPGLVVHGPLIATWLMDHYLRRHPGRRISRFSFRAQIPLFDSAPVGLFLAEQAERAALWAAGDGGPVAMSAEVEARS